jgi:hypothetical protein
VDVKAGTMAFVVAFTLFQKRVEHLTAPWDLRSSLTGKQKETGTGYLLETVTIGGTAREEHFESGPGSMLKVRTVHTNFLVEEPTSSQHMSSPVIVASCDSYAHTVREREH